MSDEFNNAFSGGETISDLVKDAVTPEQPESAADAAPAVSEPAQPQGYQPQQNPYAQQAPQANAYEQSYQAPQSPYAQPQQGTAYQQNPYAQQNYQQPQQNPYAQQAYQQQQQNPYAQQGYQQPQQNPYAQQGQPAYTTGYYQYNPSVNVTTAENDGFAVASLILSIVGIVTCCTFVPSLLGLIFGIVSKTKNDGTRPTGVSTAGIILGVIGLLLSVFWLFVFLGSGSN